MSENSNPFPLMLAVALVLHVGVLAWWKIPKSDHPPLKPERPVMQMIKLAAPPQTLAAAPSPPPMPEPPPALRPAPRPAPKPVPQPMPAPPPQLQAVPPEPTPVQREPTPSLPQSAPPPRAETVVAGIAPPPHPAANVLAGYEALLAAWLDRHKNYPLAAQRRRQEGEVLLRVRINREGRVLSFRAQDISDHPILDAAALSMVKRAEPFPPFPDDFPGSEFEFLLPVSFHLR
jgi:protein TonB